MKCPLQTVQSLVLTTNTGAHCIRDDRKYRKHTFVYLIERDEVYLSKLYSLIKTSYIHCVIQIAYIH